MSSLTHRRLRAPEEDGAALIDPPLAQIPTTIKANRAIWPDYVRPWFSLLSRKTFAREQLYGLARSYTSAYRSVPDFDDDLLARPFILTGHQPGLFHPGVWFKNFLLSEIAARVNGVAINVLIDNDVLKRPSIAVPTHNGIEPIEFDEPGETLPLEERPLFDVLRYGSFRRRIESALSRIGVDYRSLVSEMWPNATNSKQAWQSQVHRITPPTLGRRLAQSRHLLEERLGLRTYELPLSLVCQTADFQLFAGHLLTAYKSFVDIYNLSLAEFRAANHVRSRTHPAAELEHSGDYWEMPFWLWTTENPHRRTVFVCRRGDQIELTDRGQIRLAFTADTESKPGDVYDQLAEAEARGIKIRPKALITTLYCRVLLSDLFIHGIGGAKYDELTDLIIRRFFGIEPPAYVTATATFRLQIERPNVSLDDVRASARRIRELRYQPESFLRDDRVKQDAHLANKLTALAAEKREYLDHHDLRHCSHDVFDKLNAMNRAMHELLRPVEEELRARHIELIELARQSRLLGSREFSFVLFPSEKLPARLLDLSKGMA